MNSKAEITIVSVCDNHYTIMLAALIKSIEVNYTGTAIINYYVVNDKIQLENREKLESSINSDLINIIWIDISRVIPGRNGLPLDHSYFPLNIYTRLYISDFIPAEVEKVIYLDVDMIVLKDISALWNININNKTIGAVVDKSEVISNPWAGIPNYQELGLDPQSKYFNSGLLIINTKLWRSKNIAAEVVKCIKNNLDFAAFPDQYGLNVILSKDWYELEQAWNIQASKDQVEPYIIHFSGRKPIYKSYNENEDFKAYFFKYLKLTPWANYKLVGEHQRLIKKIMNKMEKKIRLLKSLVNID